MQHSAKAFLLGVVFCLSGCANPPSTSTVTSASTGNPSIKEQVALQRDSTQNNGPEEEPVVLELPRYNSSQTRHHDLLHTELHLSFNWQDQTVIGEAHLQLKPYFFETDTLVLDAKAFTINSVELITGTSSEALEYAYDGFQLGVKLDRTYTRGEEFWIQIEYVANPNEFEGRGSEAISGEKGLYFINANGEEEDKPQQIWTQGETEFSSAWFPTIDQPNEKSTQEMHITVDQRFRTLSNGRLVSSRDNGDGTRTDHWEMDKPHAPYLFMLAIGEFSVVEDSWRNIPVTYWVEPKYEPYARAIFGNTPEMLEFFSDKLGVDYPWPKYAQVVVRDFVSGAMENTSASIFMEALQVDSRQLLDKHWDEIIAHELFHHWFGDLVTCESWANLPLNESFANYSEYLWLEHKYGWDSAEYHNFEERQAYFEEANEESKQLIRFGYEDKADMFDAHSYNKGGRVLHMLRRHLGDEAFFASLNHYLTSHAYQSAEIHDLRISFETVTGVDLNWFFNQWFLSAGHPKINVRHQYDSARQMLLVEVIQSQHGDNIPDIFILPFEVEVWHKGVPTRHSLVLKAREAVFGIPMDTAPDLVSFDPDRILLAEINRQISFDEGEYLAEHSGHFYSRINGLQRMVQNIDTEEEAGRFYAAARKQLSDPFWLNRSAVTSVFANYQGEDVAEVAEQLSQMAMADPIPRVRASALRALSTLEEGQQPEPYLKALNDSAYSVVAAGIRVLSAVRMPSYALESYLTPYYDSNVQDIYLALAELFVSSENLEKQSWFMNRLQEQGDEGRFYLITYFAEYLQLLAYSERQEAMELLYDFAVTDPNYYVRANAVSALSILDDLGEWEARIEEVKAKEEDSRFFEILEE